MVKCSICGKQAIYVDKVAGKGFCKNHFISRVEKTVEETLLQALGQSSLEKTTICVAVSGGKDSTSLLYILKKLSDRYEFKVQALSIDEGIEGYRDLKIPFIEKVSRKLGVNLHVRSFREEFGLSLDQMFEILSEKGLEIKPCTVCGVFRRYLLNRIAYSLGADYLATGHNLDDEAQVLLLNIIRGSIVNIAREGGVSSPRIHERFIPRIKPLYYLTERETALYAYLNNLLPPFAECPYVVFASREVVRRWLNLLEEENPGTKIRLIGVKETLQKAISRKIGDRALRLKTCKICGEPSAGEVCKFCQLREYLGI